MQIFCESFCLSSPEMQAFDLTEGEMGVENSDEKNQPETRQDDEMDMENIVAELLNIYLYTVRTNSTLAPLQQSSQHHPMPKGLGLPPIV
jgi:hypothetical protein